MQDEPPFGAPCWISYRFDTFKAVDFYKNLFGWWLEEQEGWGANTPGQTCYRGGSKVASLVPIIEFGDPQWCVYFYCYDLDQTIASVSQAGGVVNFIWSKPGTREGPHAYFSDPMGGQFACLQPESLDSLSSFGETHGLCWVDLSTPEVDRAVNFYTDAFNWSMQRMPSNSERYHATQTVGKWGTAVGARSIEFAGIAAAKSHTPWRPYFKVNSISEAVTKVSELGGTVRRMVGRAAELADPDGVPFGIADYW
ncbi:VOC family protein [Streptomyces pseudogriseolus]|uniref:VOC family protein n=1 Tax=Streptomyces pseudogriseolus TaxID=36817 RepID=UPI003481AE5D|nr:VOC family protein [Streptomyces pseudogriseolus]